MPSVVLIIIGFTQIPNRTHHLSLFPRVACESGFYGSGCDRKCSCPPGVSCDHVTGACQPQCPAGKRGENCDEGKESLDHLSITDLSINLVKLILSNVTSVVDCVDGRFGIGCSQSCDCSGASCDKMTGRCACPAGTFGERCETGVSSLFVLCCCLNKFEKRPSLMSLS